MNPVTPLGVIGEALEVGTLVCALILCFLAWRNPGSARSVRGWALAGVACLVLCTAWIPEVAHANGLSLGGFEWTYATRAGLFLVGSCALLRSVFLDLPSQRVRTKLQSRDIPTRAPMS